MERNGRAVRAVGWRFAALDSCMKDKVRAVVLLALLAGGHASWAAESGRIDRKALVDRHRVVLTAADPLSPLSVGNGEFAFTADITGLQTFPDFHAKGMQLGMLAQWGWHTLPNPERFTLDDVMVLFDAGGRKVPYAGGTGEYARADLTAERRREATAWLRSNPHRIDLGRIGLILRRADGTEASIGEIKDAVQELDLWSGTLTSRFRFDGQPVRVTTLCHPTQDVLAVRIESAGLAEGRIGVRIEFPYALGDWGRAAAWGMPGRHRTIVRASIRRADLRREMDGDTYHVSVGWSDGAEWKEAGAHRFELTAPARAQADLIVAFAPRPRGPSLPDFGETRAVAARHWERFWSEGAAIDLSGSPDPRWKELERRLVLSQYLTAVHCAGSLPPQETGLVQNSWYGKSHLEMHWWHAAHFALWNRIALLERSLPWYRRILPAAQATARQQGYGGARWPKMVGPDGREGPSDIGVFLAWQQPHPIFYAEVVRRARGDEAAMILHKNVVLETAAFMASYARWEESGQRFCLGPPIIPAQESYGRDRARLVNPTFELAYWHWALSVAQQWRERAGLPREAGWDRVIAKLARPTVRDGVYEAMESAPYTVPHDHPSMLAALGFLPSTPLIEPPLMRATLEEVWTTWDWPSTWGWDYPMIAMTAARVERPDLAVEALLRDTPKNRWLPNGHNYQRDNLPLYLPGNGGLLYAAAMMAAGWDGGPDRAAPGFPSDGSWVVKSEGLRRAP